MERTDYCVYIHINKINGKKYIWQTCQNPEKRWGLSGQMYLKKRNGHYTQPVFAHAILKYGWENFIHEIIKDNLTKIEADELERALIEQYNTPNKDYGYNIAKGGSYDFMNEITKEKISQSNKEFYKYHQHHMAGVQRTEDFKQLMHDKMLNREFSEETKKKMSRNHADVSGGKNPRAKAVRCIETGEEFSCAADAGRAYGLAPGNPGADVRKCCDSNYRTAGHDKISNEPLHWEWIN